MAGSSSGKGAYWLGALAGLIVSGGIVAGLLISEAPIAVPGAEQTAAVPQPEPVPVTPEPEETAPAPPVTPAEPSEIAEAPPEETAPEPDAPAPAATAEPDVAATPVPDTNPTEPATPDPTGEADASAPQALPNAIVEHSEFFQGDPAEPVLAIVLVGVGDQNVFPNEVFLLPAPLTLAIDAASVDARSLVTDARDSGFEALIAVSDVPEGEGALAAQLDQLDGVIGIAALDGSISESATIPGVVETLQARGMVLLDGNIGSAAYRAARTNGLPAAELGRSIDEFPSSAMIFQSLERAAFDARQSGMFVVIAEANPAVLTGLQRWMRVKAGKSVAIAPLSEVMRRAGKQN